MEDGSIEILRLRQAVDEAGYSGPIEVEIFNQEIWDTSGDKTLASMIECYVACV
jgi:sugar phosphate isomerase/epimerase